MHTLCDKGLKNLTTWVFHLAQKAKESLAQENALLPKSPLIDLLRLSFNVIYSMKSRKYKEPETEEILKQLSATNISEQAKGKGKHFYYQKIFSHL